MDESTMIDEGYNIKAGRDNKGHRWIEIEHVVDRGGYNVVESFTFIENGMHKFLNHVYASVMTAEMLPKVEDRHCEEDVPKPAMNS